jgi:hypothetical protein
VRNDLYVDAGGIHLLQPEVAEVVEASCQKAGPTGGAVAVSHDRWIGVMLF